MIGIMPPEMDQIGDAAEAWVPIAFTPQQLNIYDEFYLTAYVRQRKDVTQQQVRDVFQERLESLLEHDRAHGSQLFRTVEVYLECQGNAKLAASEQVAQVAGPGATGVLLRFLGAPLLIAFDALSFLLSALFIWRIRHVDDVPDRASRRGRRARPSARPGVWWRSPRARARAPPAHSC